MSSNSLATQSVRTSDFLNSIGINTHIDFTWTAYGNLQTVENDINYLGVKNLRDSASNTNDLGTNGLWQQVANATDAKFDDFIGQGSPAIMKLELPYMSQLANQHLLNFVEGGNEEDDTYALLSGNTLATTAAFQQQVYSTGHYYGIPVINMSFGAGWNTSASGDYAKVGNISAYSDYSNAHTYFGTGNTPSYNIGFVNSLAQISSNHPTITTEMGWYTTGIKSDATSVSETAQAKYMLDGLMDAYKAGDVKTYLYELLDNKTGDGYSEDNFGLFHSNGTPKAAAVALHNMTTLLADTGTSSATFTPGALSYSLSGTQATDNSMLMEKSDGTYWLSIWNEARVSSATSSTDITVPNHTVTLNLGATAGTVTIFDPLTGTSAIQTYSNTQTVQISLPDHPVLVEISGPQAAASGTTGTGTTGGGSTGSSTGTTTGSSTSSTAGSNDLGITTPATLSLMQHDAVQVTGATIQDAWAQGHAGIMALDVSATTGTLSMVNGYGQFVSGSGTHDIHLTGTLSQLNADLATLAYQAGSAPGTDAITINAYNQAGVSGSHTIAVNTLLPGNVQGTSGNDILSGTSGGTVTGGGGADTFYATASNAGLNNGALHIADFSQASGDKIDLHGFGLTSANFSSTGAFTGSKSFTFSQLTDTTGHAYTMIKIDTNGDHIADHEIMINHAHVSLHSSDFTFV